ncbi:alpha/beta fold hydrolase [Actinosynnema sp. NPDC047251]|uniref:TAP domain containing protein n=1 Tax=Saccharothrix espanaensis (strain ATCC 51144 / DSM 44229 / JCM 9112 / NBRC 15066 / NRRL 15764) TaxID=1179773 RepID=K0JVE6_SACES|nr:alpha/beta fold hydrolase [Saccharothrix espanaensis]CCH28148.1 TAP domain containing protein [Saccharothrix espanaensis DSM 44229]
MARLHTTLAALAVATGLLAGVGSAVAAPAGESARGGLSRFYDQRLDWKSCDDGLLDASGAQCADVTVPLDYQQPRGRTITVAISRLKATDPAQRRGIMLSNPGGPGGPGLAMMARIKGTMSPAVQARYDLVGMDPRGVGRSTPIDCGWPEAFMQRSAGYDRAAFDRSVAFAADRARRCAEKEGGRLPHITTRNTARDMDVVRGAMGEKRISYLGWSYGTYLGAVYTQMFPQRTDRFVLDSAIDPAEYGTEVTRAMGAPSEAVLDDWAAWTARRDAEYHLGTTGKQVRGAVEGLVRQAAKAPIKVGDYAVDAHVLPFLLAGPLPSPGQYAGYTQYVRQLLDAAAGAPVVPGGELEASLTAVFRPGAATDDDAQAAVFCGDVSYPRDPEWYWKKVQRSRAAQPVFGAFVNNITACAFWAKPREERTVVRNDRPALIVQATGDFRTAYGQGVGLHKAMTGSRLVTLKDVAVHGVFGRYPDKCAEDAVNTYLADGRLPAQNITCHAGK